MVKSRKKSPCRAKFKKYAPKVKKIKKRIVRAKKDFLDKILSLF